MAQKILVTGASGFIGRALCTNLSRRSYQVRCAVRDSSRACNVPGEPVVVGDLAQDTDWASAVEGVHAIVHLAARVHIIRETAAQPLIAFRRVNVDATERLARSAVLAGVKRLVYVSSIGVNGVATAARPFTACDPPRPHNAYALSKLEAEQRLRAVADETGLEVVVLRPPLVYGPGVIGNFLRLLKLIAAGVPLPFGAVENCRSFIYSVNLADALTTCATHPAAAEKTYVVSDGEDISTPGLIMAIAALFGRAPRLWAAPPGLLRFGAKLLGRADEIERVIGSLRVDSSRIRAELDWTPPYTLSQGLAETVRWFIAKEPAYARK